MWRKKVEKKISLFLDSGAYSAWSRGASIDIQNYICFIKENIDLVDVYSNLDVIGDPEMTLSNQRIMEKAGLFPLPCFHYGEDFKFLEFYISNYNYVGLGGMVPIPTKQLIPWLDVVFSRYVCDKKTHLPKIKIHGFGMTSLLMMLRYPWWGVDSTSWVMTSRMGSVYVPRFKSGQWIYDENSWKITVSSRSPFQQDVGQHFNTFSPEVQKVIVSYFQEKGYKMGQSEFRTESKSYKLKVNERWNGKVSEGKREVELIQEEGICNSYRQRDEMNIIYFLDLEKSMPEWPWPFKKQKKGFGLL